MEHGYVLLAHEVMRLKADQSLFTFVTAPSPTQPNGMAMTVGGMNNEAERTLPNPAEARKTGRTNKSAAGTSVTSVLQSLRLYLSNYGLKTVIAETLRWLQTDRSCFEEQLQKLKLKLPQECILQQVYQMRQPTDKTGSSPTRGGRNETSHRANRNERNSAS